MHSADKKNIVICGYQKSGTIWATRLVAELLKCPSVGYWGYPKPYTVTEGLNRQSKYACFQSHHSFEELQQLKPQDIYRLIYIVRDPKDIWVSGIYHFPFERPWFSRFAKIIPSGIVKTSCKKIHQKLLSARYRKKRMLRMLFEGDDKIPHARWSWQTHIESHLENDKSIIIRYEDLLMHTHTTCKQVLEYCNEPEIDSNHILKSIENQSFDKRKEEFAKGKEKLKFNHLRKGIAGDWKNHLNDKDCERLVARLGYIMKRLGYNTESV